MVFFEEIIAELDLEGSFPGDGQEKKQFSRWDGRGSQCKSLEEWGVPLKNRSGSTRAFADDVLRRQSGQGRQTQRGHTGRSRVGRAFGHLWAQSTREISVSPGTSYLLRLCPWLFALLVWVSGSFARKMTAVGKELIFLRIPVQVRAVLQIQLLNLAVSPPFLYFHSWVFSHTPEGKLKLRALLCMSEVCLHAYV